MKIEFDTKNIKNHIVPIIAVFAIIIITIVAIFVVVPIITQKEMPVSNITVEGIRIEVPSLNYTKDSYGQYVDENDTIQIDVGNSALEFGIIGRTLDARDDQHRITLEGIPRDALVWESDGGYTNILVPNENGTRYVLVGAKNMTQYGKNGTEIAKMMANSVKFTDTNETKVG